MLESPELSGFWILWIVAKPYHLAISPHFPRRITPTKLELNRASPVTHFHSYDEISTSALITGCFQSNPSDHLYEPCFPVCYVPSRRTEVLFRIRDLVTTPNYVHSFLCRPLCCQFLRFCSLGCRDSLTFAKL